jgi:hypothetical protein
MKDFEPRGGTELANNFRLKIFNCVIVNYAVVVRNNLP